MSLLDVRNLRTYFHTDRGEARSVTESTVPIDVLGAEEFANQGDTDLSNLLRNVVPSWAPTTW